MNTPEVKFVELKSFKQFVEEEAMGAGGGTGAVATNVTGDSAKMAMPPDMGKKKLVKRQEFPAK